MENGDCTFLARPRYKQRKVSAIRDFPEECGPFVSKNAPVSKVDIADSDYANNTVLEDKNDEHVEGGTDRVSKCDKDTQHSELKNDTFLTENLDQAIDCGLMKENSVVSSLQVDEPNLSNYEPANATVVGMDTFDTELERTEKSVKHDSAAGEAPMINGEVPMIDCSKSLSSDINVAYSGACMGEAGTKRYLPRKKVSAVREFPPFCGPHAPRLSMDYCLKGISSLNNNRADQQVLAVDDSLLKKAATTDVKENNTADEYHKRKLVDIVQVDYEGNANLPSENKRGKYIALPEESNRQISMKTKAADKEESRDAVMVEGTSRLEIIVHPEVQSLETMPLDKSTSQCKLNGNRLAVSSDRKVVLGLIATSQCPWSFDRSSTKSNLFGGTNEDKGAKADSFARPDKSKTVVKALKKKKGSSPTNDRCQLVISEKKDSFDPNEIDEDWQIVPKSHSLNVNVFPFGHNSLVGHENDSNVTRQKVRETLRLFQAVSRKLLHEVEAKSNERANTPKRVDLQAAKILKDKGKYVNTGDKILGSVPGVEVGDEFKFRVELNIVGLHRQIQGGIDYVKHNGKILATAIVASGGYADDLDNSDVLTYTGQGGNVMSTDKEPEDQKLERGNLALKNSIEEKNPVRVIRGYESSEGRTYVYDGLYRVDSSWQEMGPHGKLVYRFRLLRISGQPELALKEVKKSKKFKTREGLCVDDISYGKERIPVCAVNTIDDEKPPPFTYITSMMYPDGCNLAPPEGCYCTNGCSDSEKCPCVVKNGGEIPFNHDEAIVEAKPLVYECGPCCKCPSTCHNRVSQLGIKFQLEIFKTPTRGWGVRSLNSIPSGSFICEYIGEVLEDKEAEQRTGNDEYLFDIGNNYNNNTLWDGLSTLMPDSQISSAELVKDGGFTIDALEFANVGRFINHSCSPNLYAQNVLYDHHDKRIPHIMFFAAENIPPLQELAYDYNYKIDQVYDSDGNIKKKDCFCGSSECSGRMY
ncbi:histone-lysine N-methyltransferase, H3 lysine-9 specific SUVH6-like [Lotus japonicus]|uniref:histone-lysine N-methyltransferase, H3 lysine-9 specific SUVH6-like n=1 Tax=Lotus japonicus TaxID=34305 RepID=UPI00258D144D|nr:histone-lysine N-methyltransferase, H3 lysine-9 specific SUVH6-like [Lotus japonicus]XP_057449754.1 histone-lysine N-methyltransferase, H3 lysine-9 specific SUVH6-like [Lotus japonicus]XP_057449755.1 histone-lysine N-methyltransferase, H3 lysine-9 specific SUVH6-like [Lotus japonicus]